MFILFCVSGEEMKREREKSFGAGINKQVSTHAHANVMKTKHTRALKLKERHNKPKK